MNGLGGGYSSYLVTVVFRLFDEKWTGQAIEIGSMQVDPGIFLLQNKRIFLQLGTTVDTGWIHNDDESSWFEIMKNLFHPFDSASTFRFLEDLVKGKTK